MEYIIRCRGRVGTVRHKNSISFFMIKKHRNQFLSNGKICIIEIGIIKEDVEKTTNSHKRKKKLKRNAILSHCSTSKWEQ